MNRRFQFKEGIKNQGAICVMRVFDLQKKQDCLAKAIDKRASQILYRQASREMTLLQSIREDGFPVLEYAEENEDQLIYYETWIEGVSLEKWLKTKPSRRRKKNVFAQICDRIAAVHNQGFLYMDLKPEHILIDEDQKVWLIDFNAVIPIGSGQAILSNDLALPPENGIQNLDVQADQPGIGSLHRMIFGASSVSWSCLQEKPGKRFRSIQDLKKAACISPTLCGFLSFCLISVCLLAAKIPGVSASENTSMPRMDFSGHLTDPASFSVSYEQALVAMIEKQENSSGLSDHEMLLLMKSVLTAAEKNPLIVRLFLDRVEVPESMKKSTQWTKICFLAGESLESRSFQMWIDELITEKDIDILLNEVRDLLRILISSEICLDPDLQQALENSLRRIPVRELTKKTGSLILQYALMEISTGRVPIRLSDDLIKLLEQDSDTAAMAQLYRIKTQTMGRQIDSKKERNQSMNLQLPHSK